MVEVYYTIRPRQNLVGFTKLASTTMKECLQPRRGFAILMAIGLWLSIVGIWSYPLLEPDEAKHALIVRAMLEGSFWMPYLNGEPFFDKPILPFALMAVFAKFLGMNEVALRLPGALLGFASVIVLYRFVLRLRGDAEAFWAGFIWTTSPLFLAASHIPTHDIYLAFFSVLSAFAGFRLLTEQGTPTESRFLGIGFWLGLAGGVLSKGLLGIVLPGIALLGPALVERQSLKAAAKRFLRIEGIACFLLLVLPWYAYVLVRYPEFGPSFLVRQHLGNFLGSLPRHPEPFWYYLPLLFGVFFPWAFFLPFIPFAWRPERKDRAFVALCASQSLGIFLFFSVAASKLPLYILPALPGFCMSLAPFLVKHAPARERHLKILLGFVAVVFLAAIPYGLVFAKSAYPGFFRPAAVLSVLMIPVLLVAILFSWRGTVGWLKGYIVFGLVFLYTLGFLCVTPLVGSYSSSKAAVQRLKQNASEDAVVVCYRRDCLSAQFYLGRPVKRIEHLDRNMLVPSRPLYVLVKKKHLIPFLAEARPLGIKVEFRSEGFWLIRVG